MPDQDEPLRPRFKIERRRLSSDESGQNEEAQEEDFTPDKVIYCEIDDEITNIFDVIKRVRGKRIALVIPKRAIMLQSIVNLKILKKKIDELDKELVIVTTDVPGLQLVQKAGIPSMERLFEKDSEAKIPLHPPPLRGQRPQRMTGEKVSLSQVIRQPESRFLSSMLGRIKERIKKKRTSSQGTKIVFVAPNKQALFTLILVSVLLLLTVAYIALPGATIYLTPKSSVLDPSFNVTFLDFGKNRGLLEGVSGSGSIILASYAVRPPAIQKKIMHNATGKIFHGKNAHGTVTVTNLSSAPWDLAATTRFQTPDGLIFRTPTAVRVPAASAAAPGKLEVAVVADEFDVNLQVIGDRGNIGPTKFTLPGLKNEENRKKLYGESFAPMVGGVTETVKVVSKEDIAAAQEAAKRDIMNNAAEDLKRYLEEQNLIKKTNLSLLQDRNAIEISEPGITVPGDIIGKITGQFEITAMYNVSGVAFDRRELVNALKDRLISRTDPDKKILKVEEDDVSYRFLDKDTSAGRLRLTATMRAVQIYELDPEKENGHRFIKKITDHILGMSVKDAQTYLEQQTDEISRVEITTWPIWAPTIPNIVDNVKFVIREQNDLQ